MLDDLPADNAGVADYLVSEVIDALPADQRDVALAVSVVDEFDAPLAAGLAGRAGRPEQHALVSSYSAKLEALITAEVGDDLHAWVTERPALMGPPSGQ